MPWKQIGAAKTGLFMEALEQRCMLAGDILFSKPDHLETPPGPAGVVSEDVNRDGVSDLIVSTTEGSGGDASVLLGNGDGTFASSHRVSLGAGPAIAAADLNGDGYPDLISARAPNSQGVYVALNKGLVDGEWEGFDRRIRFSMTGPTQDVFPGDFDNDGDLDVAVGHSRHVPVVLNNGTTGAQWNGFADPIDYQAGSHSSTVVAGDVDSDGDLDLVVGNYFGGDISVLSGNGDGTFADAVNYQVGSRGSGVKLADLDGDGDLDAAVPVFDSRQVVILSNHGDGTFAEGVIVPVSQTVRTLSLADLDSDGDMDLIVATGNVDLMLLINDGAASFSEHGETLRTTTPRIKDINVSDMDQDGDADIAAVVRGSRAGVEVFWNRTPVIAPGQPGDSNRDGVFDQLDIVRVCERYKQGRLARWCILDFFGVHEREDV